MSDRLSILQHALGLDQYGQGDPYRSHYVAGPGSDGWILLNEMTTEGLLVRHEPRQIYGNDYCFVVTDSGRDHVRANSPKPPRQTRSQKRYRDWLNVADLYPDANFGDYLKRKTP